MACNRDMDWSPWEVLSLAFLQAAGICDSDKYCINIPDKHTYRKVPKFSDAFAVINLKFIQQGQT